MNVQSRYQFLSLLSAVMLRSVGILAWGPRSKAETRFTASTAE
jgi:hypothetical protein